MFKPTRLKIGHSLTLIQDVKDLVTIAFSNPREVIIENPYTAFAGSFGTIASLWFAAYNPSGVWIIFIIALIIFIPGLFIEANKYKIYTQDALPIPIVINIANQANSLDALNSLFTVIEKDRRYRKYQEKIKKYLGILNEDLVFKYDGDIFDQKRLKLFLKIVRHDLEQVKRRTPQNSILYLAYIGPISVSFLIGSMLSREGMILFQRDQSNNSYQAVMEVRDRTLKENIQGFEKLEVNYLCSNPPQPKVTIAIDTASHKIKLNDPSIQGYGDLITLDNQTSNTIDYQEDWTQYCREIFQVLNDAQQDYQEIRLVYSMPVTLAIAVGMTTQNFWNIVLTNYDGKTGTYQDLIRMNDMD
ncbi:conserved membrane hypothetical protein [Planktothrix sp. PCC 11201]|uniref:SAVED domain-containing protein n=1 Tax=Planktothrix sp. PCC 11201 TaxID=1729650 RepID=UPI0009217B1C|nr:SAVED domain-containing protein [Planktothrix sp. PCC 11201]SKB13808.1 conserved membrane hypothetical protein [Planktothrix sp. PCC 11201]